MSSDSRVEQLFGTLPSRRWDLLEDGWLEYVPNNAKPGVCPERTVEAALEERGLFGERPPRDKITTLTTPPEGMAEIVFCEGLYWLHKAVHVLGSAEVEAEKGMLTWSLSSGYQAAYFAARATLAFLGVTVAEVDKVSIIVDLCRNTRGLKPKDAEELGAFSEQVTLSTACVLFDHRQTWGLYQRILRTATRLCLPDDWVSFLSNVAVADITKQRHGLHYHLDYWVMDDLQAFLDHTGFSDLTMTGTGKTLYDPESKNLSLAIGCLAVRAALKFLGRVASSTKHLEAEMRLFEKTLVENRHPLYAQQLRIDLGIPAPTAA